MADVGVPDGATASMSRRPIEIDGALPGIWEHGLLEEDHIVAKVGKFGGSRLLSHLATSQPSGYSSVTVMR